MAQGAREEAPCWAGSWSKVPREGGSEAAGPAGGEARHRPGGGEAVHSPRQPPPRTGGEAQGAEACYPHSPPALLHCLCHPLGAGPRPHQTITPMRGVPGPDLIPDSPPKARPFHAWLMSVSIHCTSTGGRLSPVMLRAEWAFSPPRKHSQGMCVWGGGWGGRWCGVSVCGGVCLMCS